MAWKLRLKEKPAAVAGADGRALYINNCSACHGENRAGNPPEFPSLIGIGSRLDPMDMFMTISSGSGRMPGFASLGQETIGAIMGYLLNPDTRQAAAPTVAEGKVTSSPPAGDAYVFDGYNKFLDPDGYPAIAPPWGTLNVINLSTGGGTGVARACDFPPRSARTPITRSHTGSSTSPINVKWLTVTKPGESS
jgi:quinoprotein glucose dehydrogenase